MYEFKESDAYDFARHVGIKTYKSGNNLHFTKCPYCKNTTNDKNTFAIDLSTGRFNCLRASCGAKGNMITLSKDFGYDIGLASEYYTPRKRYKKLPNKKPDKVGGVVSFLEKRGISEQTAKAYRLTADKKHENVLVFPFYDESDELQFIKYRDTTFVKGKSKGNKEWCEAKCKPILFGMHLCDAEKCSTLVITEGQMDSLSIAEAGIPNAVSVPNGAKGFTWLPYCWDFLCKFKEIIVFGDYENGNITLLEELHDRLSSNVIVKHPRKEAYKDCKDANEILVKYGKEALVAAVNEAVIIENKHIMSLSSVKRKNYSDIDGFRSNIKALDKIIDKFYMGQLIILSGERGHGKSTFASQLGINAVMQGFPTLFYSGELNDWQFQHWFDLNIAGANFINKIIDSKSDYASYSVDRESEFKIESWYKDLAYIYDNSKVDTDNESLIDTIEVGIKQYGFRVIFIDNLMTAVDDDTSVDVYRQQANFAKQLKTLAGRFDVCIFLVAHPKKRSADSWSNDDIAGSSQITNLADTVLVYSKERSDDDESNIRKLLVLKNRTTGICNYKGIVLFFEECSKRISEQNGYFSWNYGWEISKEDNEEDDGFNTIGNQAELPFDDPNWEDEVDES